MDIFFSFHASVYYYSGKLDAALLISIFVYIYAIKVYICLQGNGVNITFADTQGTAGAWAAVTLNAFLRLAAGDSRVIKNKYF